ncbi:MAG: DNA gyrase C-terminal beta-propeller domain-containing protein, partial [Kordiimonas sp.]
TDQGKLIRTPVHDVRIASRNTKGVTLFKVADDEHIVSVAKLLETNDDEEGQEDNAEGDIQIETEASEAGSEE